MKGLSFTEKNWFILASVFLLFLAPVLVSYWSVRVANVSSEADTTNYGNLIIPARPLPERELISASGDDGPITLRGKWNLVYFVFDECSDNCKKGLFSLNQIEQALGKDSLRVQRVAVVVQWEKSQQILEKYPRLWIWSLAGDRSSGVLDMFTTEKVSASQIDGQVYIVDPLGNLMMHYDPGFDPYGVLRDLRRLLKASQIG